MVKRRKVDSSHLRLTGVAYEHPIPYQVSLLAWGI